MATTDTLKHAAKQLADLAELYDPTNEMLDDYIAGYPAQTAGAAPASNPPRNVDDDPIRCLTQLKRPGAKATYCQIPMPCPVHHTETVHATDLLAAIPPTTPRAPRHQQSAQPVPPRRSVENLALADGTDEAAAALELIAATSDKIVNLVDALNQQLRKWPPPRRTSDKHGDGIHCTQHLKLGLFFKIAYGGLCRWCADFKAEQNRLPSLVLLQQKHEGVRITPAMRTNDHPARRVTRTGRPKAKPMHRCPGPKCKTDIPDGIYACRPHWFSLPPDIRAAINKAWRRVTNGHAEAIDEHDTATAAARDYWKIDT